MTVADTPAGHEPVRRLNGDAGGNLVEYSMLLALILVVCLTAVSAFAKATFDKTNCVQSAVSSEVGADC